MKGKQESLEYKKKVELEEANAIAEKMKEIKVVLKAKAGENGKLFGSVTSKDVSKQIKDELGIDIDKRKIVMPDVKAFGTVQAEIKVYQGISAKVFVQVSEA